MTLTNALHPTSPALLTDRYELTMLAAALRDETADKQCVFEAFTRRLPSGRGYGVVAGTERLLEMIEHFAFSAEELAYLRQAGVIDDTVAEYLASWSFTGNIYGYEEGDLYFPYSPVLRVESTFAEAVVLETLILSVLNHDCAVASAAARMVQAAAGRPLLEMGSRRTHEQAAVAAARAAYLTGFQATSNLAAGMTYGVPTMGTSAHAFTLAHRHESEAFAAQLATLGETTTLLVDTYDIAEGIRTAVRQAGPRLGAVRLDSGNPGDEARAARALLDSLGATHTRIVSTGDMDEFVIAGLADEPIDVFGVGTRLVTGSGHPTAGFVYKLVAIEDDAESGWRRVAKTASGKTSTGGVKTPYRLLDAAGVAVAEVLAVTSAPSTEVALPRDARPLHHPLVLGGRRRRPVPLADQRTHHIRVMAQLPPAALALLAQGPAIPTHFISETDNSSSATDPATYEMTATTKETTMPTPTLPANTANTAVSETHHGVEPSRALIVVDVQNDFTEGGTLAVAGGDDVARAIGEYTAAHRKQYSLVITTQDFHIDPGAHFSADPDFIDSWPEHCRAGTPGADLDPLLDHGAGVAFQSLVDITVKKGHYCAAYSGFEGVVDDRAAQRPHTATGAAAIPSQDHSAGDLAQVLSQSGVSGVDIVGIATDHCVKATALDAARLGLQVRVLRNMCAAVSTDGEHAAWEELAGAGVELR